MIHLQRSAERGDRLELEPYGDTSVRLRWEGLYDDNAGRAEEE